MVFKENDKFVRYKIVYSNRWAVARMVLDRLNNITVGTQISGFGTTYGTKKTFDKNGIHVDHFYYHSLAVQTDRISSKEPYTIALAQPALCASDKYSLSYDEHRLLDAVNNDAYRSRLANVLHSDCSLESLLKIIETLGSNEEALRIFYNEYQSDLIALRRLLPYLTLVEVESLPIEELQQKIKRWTLELKQISKKIGLDTKHPKVSLSSYPHAIEKMDSIKAKIADYPRELVFAEENTEIAKILNLHFNKQHN